MEDNKLLDPRVLPIDVLAKGIVNDPDMYRIGMLLNELLPERSRGGEDAPAAAPKADDSMLRSIIREAVKNG